MADGGASGREANGKGKGKATEPSPASEPEHAAAAKKEDSGALLPRVAHSAASLLLSGPPGGDALGGSNEKGESSRVGEALARAGESSVRLRPGAPANESMRSGRTEEHIARETASFAAFLDGPGASVLTAPSDGDLEGAWRTATRGPAATETTATRAVAAQSVAEQEANDGADVVALLSGEGDLDAAFSSTGYEPPSPDDMAALRRALFGDGADQGSPSIAWDNALNFIPDYLQVPSAESEIRAGDSLPEHMGTGDADEAWQAWISQWSRVLTSYQDEVWGDLGALVDEARAEVRRIEETKPGERPPEPKALLRLRAILSHLRAA